MPHTCLVPQGDRDETGPDGREERALRLGGLAADALNRALDTMTEQELDQLEARLREFVGLAEAG